VSPADKSSEKEYTPREWEEIAASASFGDLATDQVVVLYRRWLWAEFAHEVYEEEAEMWEPSVSDRFMLGRDVWALYVWCGLLFVLIEGMTERRVRYGGKLESDIGEIREPLNAARNATFRVGAQGSDSDERLRQVMHAADAQALERVHWALGQLLRTELSRRPLHPQLRWMVGLNDTDSAP
jgi:hypothetical protein